MLRHEIVVLTQAIARALDLDDDGVAQDDRGDDRIAKNLAPFGEASEDHGVPRLRKCPTRLLLLLRKLSQAVSTRLGAR